MSPPLSRSCSTSRKIARPGPQSAGLLQAAARGLILTLGSVLATQPAPLLAQPRPLVHALTLVAPGSAGGSFARTAQAVAAVVRSGGLAGQVDVRLSPGAGGLIGLAQFASSADPSARLLVAGVTTIGAGVENRSTVTLGDVAPVCELYRTPVAIAVGRASPIHSLGELLALLRSDPHKLEWVGGSPGSADEQFLHGLEQALGIAPNAMSFLAEAGGGGVVVDALLKAPQRVAIRNLDEFTGTPRHGDLRILAIAAEQRLPGIALPTLREAGVDLVFEDWKGLFAARSSPPAQRRAMGALCSALLADPAWQAEARRHIWLPPGSTQAQFPARIAAQERRTIGLLADRRVAARGGLTRRLGLFWMLVGGGLATVAAGFALWWRRRAVPAPAVARPQPEAPEPSPVVAEAGERDTIGAQFVTWNLSPAESEIGWMILKGLPFKDIAASRGTSERTVRQQAQNIYSKSGLANRSEFSAFFLEDMRF